MKRLFLLLIVLAVTLPANATTWVSNGSKSDVQSIHDNVLTLDGDIITLPAGTFGYGVPQLTITKGITLQGAGIGQTILQDDVPVLGSSAIQVTLKAGLNTRITGIEFREGTRSAVWGAFILITGSRVDARRIILDNCKFNMVRGAAVSPNGALGVICWCQFVSDQQLVIGFIRGQHWSDATADTYGDGSYAAADGFGTEEFLFMENNTTTGTAPANHLTTVDGDGGSRWVFRYNSVTNGSVESHGLESGGRFRSGRAFEIYNNTFTGNNFGGNILLQRGGISVVHHNTVSGYSAANFPMSLENNRSEGSPLPFSIGNAERQGADGKNPWDINTAGGPFGTGTVATFTSGSQTSTITVSGTPWTLNQWAGYTIYRTNGATVKSVTSLSRSSNTVTAVCPSHGFTAGDVISINGASIDVYNTNFVLATIIDANTFTYPLDFGAGTPANPTGTIVAMSGLQFSQVVSNTSNSLIYKSSASGANYFLRFDVSGTFEFWHVERAMDQVGRMGGSLITGDVPIRPGPWNDQTTSPCYCWLNFRESATPIGYQAIHSVIVENTDFINFTVKPGYSTYTYPHPLNPGQSGVVTGGTATVIGTTTVTGTLTIP